MRVLEEVAMMHVHWGAEATRMRSTLTTMMPPSFPPVATSQVSGDPNASPPIASLPISTARSMSQSSSPPSSAAASLNLAL